MWDYLWWVEKYSYLCGQLLLTVMRWKSIIYEVCGNHIVSVCSLFGDGVTLRSGGAEYACSNVKMFFFSLSKGLLKDMFPLYMSLFLSDTNTL